MKQREALQNLLDKQPCAERTVKNLEELMRSANATGLIDYEVADLATLVKLVGIAEKSRNVPPNVRV